MAEIDERLQRCFADVFPDMPAEEIPIASMASVASWDSLTAVTLNAVVEEEFQLQIDAADLDEFVSYELILDHLRRTLQDREPSG